MRLIGYWDGPDSGEGWPDVCAFVSADVDPGEQRAVAARLRSGTVLAVSAGFSVCRLCGRRNGSAELTDGRHFWWPEGLAHYVEDHGVRLPAEVLKPGGADVAGDGTQWWAGLAREPYPGPHLFGCRHHCEVASWNLPARADIHVDRMPSDARAALARIRRLLGQDWPLSGLRGMLAAQPFRVLPGGDPAALRRGLIGEPELRPYLFYEVDGQLLPVWTPR